MKARKYLKYINMALFPAFITIGLLFLTQGETALGIANIIIGLSYLILSVSYMKRSKRGL